MAGHAPSLTVLLGHLQQQIVLTEPLWIACFLTAGNTAGRISLVQITWPFSGQGDFLHDHLGTVIVGTCFSGRFRTFSGPHDRKFLPLSYRFYPNWPLRCRSHAWSHRHRKGYLVDYIISVEVHSIRYRFLSVGTHLLGYHTVLSPRNYSLLSKHTKLWPTKIGRLHNSHGMYPGIAPKVQL